MRLLLTFTLIVAVGIAHAYVINNPDDDEDPRDKRSAQKDWKVSYGRDGAGGVITRGEVSRRFGTPDGSVEGQVSSYVDRVEGGYNDGYQGAGASSFASSTW